MSFHRIPFRSLMGAIVLVAAASALRADALPTPTFAEVTVHDPSMIKVGARWYVYGSHGASAWTEDLMHWTQVATSVTAGNPAHFNTFGGELAELIAWTNANTLWASDVVQLPDGKFYYYYNVWTNYLSYRSYMGLASANGIEGPFADVGEIMKGGTNVAGFNPSIHPNTIDPDVFYDRDGQLWMVYGSYSGGIFILRLDQTVGSANFGRPLPGQGWGTKLMGGDHARIEGPCILYSPETEYYYLFVSFGGLGANDGYNIRMARSRNPDGPYVDASNAELTNVGGADAAIAPHGVKLMGNYQFASVSGEPRTTSRGYRSPGHNSAYRDPETGKYFLVFHTRFVGRGEQHEVRVHQMWLNEDDWFVAAPQRYAGETIARITARQVPVDFKLINHGKAISGAVATSAVVGLNADGTVSGAANGTWAIAGENFVTLGLDGVSYRGVLARHWDDDNQVWVLGFSALSSDGVAVWGSKVAAVGAVVAPTLTSAPEGRSVAAGGSVVLTAAATGAPAVEFEWTKNGVAIAGATEATLTIADATAADSGVYSVEAGNFAGVSASGPAIVGLSTDQKFVGPGQEIVSNQYVAFNHNTFDQIALEGAALAVKADYSPDPAQNQITRVSFVDIDGDIVQVEMSGPGTLSLVLDGATGRELAAKYNQPGVLYMKGHAGIVITGANEFSNVSVFSVGRATAANQTLFKDGVDYDGIAGIAFIAIATTNGKFGGVRTANAHYFAEHGLTGVYAPGVAFQGPVFVGDVTAFGAAEPVMVLGSSGDVRVTGGDMAQPNGRAVAVSGIVQLKFTAGGDSHGRAIEAQANRGVFTEQGKDVTAGIVVGP